MRPWHRLEEWFKAHAPKIHRDLLDPATPAEIQATESALGVRLPTEMVDAYLIHNGQDTISAAVAGDWQILSLDVVVTQWKIQKKLLDAGKFANAKVKVTGPVRPVWWSDKWVPFAYNGSGDLICVDLDPVESGTVGQIVVYLHDNEKRECIAKGMTEWLDRLADDLGSGKLKPAGG